MGTHDANDQIPSGFLPPSRAGRLWSCGKELARGLAVPLLSLGPPTLLRVWWGLRGAHRRDRHEGTGATVSAR